MYVSLGHQTQNNICPIGHNGNAKMNIPPTLWGEIPVNRYDHWTAMSYVSIEHTSFGSIHVIPAQCVQPVASVNSHSNVIYVVINFNQDEHWAAMFWCRNPYIRSCPCPVHSTCVASVHKYMLDTQSNVIYVEICFNQDDYWIAMFLLNRYLLALSIYQVLSMYYLHNGFRLWHQ
jgi:hypothetical protein